MEGSGGGGAAPRAAAQLQVVAQLSLREAGRGFLCWGPLATTGLDRTMVVPGLHPALWEVIRPW